MRTLFHLYRYYRRNGATFTGAAAQALRVYQNGF